MINASKDNSSFGLQRNEGALGCIRGELQMCDQMVIVKMTVRTVMMVRMWQREEEYEEERWRWRVDSFIWGDATASPNNLRRTQPLREQAGHNENLR